jgi:hypothetical protein
MKDKMSASGDVQRDTSTGAMNGASAPGVTDSSSTPQSTTPPTTTPTTTPTSATSPAAAREIGRWWWAWIVVGVLWIFASFAILRFGQASVSVVGIIIGVMVLAAGVQDIVVGALAWGWKWLWFIVGGLLIVGGLVMLFNPTKTFLVTASILGFLFLLIGAFWVVEAFATKAMNPLWWLGLIAGVMMVGLGFWASGQFLVTKAYELLIFAGIWALLQGITDIVKAFQIKRLGSLPAADMTADMTAA